MNCPTEIVELMHKYLDEEIEHNEEIKLRSHLQKCEDCSRHFYELEKAIAFVQSTSHVVAPDDFTMKIMQNLPKEKKTVSMRRWFRIHPLLTAASLFCVLMLGSIFSIWNENQEFSVSKQTDLIIENNTVIVPEDKVIKEDIVVRNGTIIIEGQVKGNVTIINGDKYLASAGHVTGEIKEVNELFEWLWYHIKKVANEVVDVFEEEENSLS
ncbi:anti-sigma factor [Bacillus luteolus]|uniref:Anti-sigma factor n=1 Tax=Litchfieldia luteola TaxID=682179 RepID=A0ABR9QMH3_9BACI|nr:anti-sigma factor [Cytobacillus luteolus]MBE4909692.1 anti-sigma factor [Cytobacillus luteolus]MBP1944554.1 anti-sigma factor RsiW [Cytobacillus luteolus]